MKAYFIYDEKKQIDMMVVPEIDCIVSVNRSVMEVFISVAPDFSKFSGEHLNGLPPESFGRIIATRESQGDVCILEDSLWRQRMAFYLS